MAEVDTTMLSSEHGDIRREQAIGFADTRYNIATNAGDIRREIGVAACDVNKNVSFEGQETVMAVKDARHDIISSNDSDADRIVDRVGEARSNITDRIAEGRVETADRFFTVGRDTMDLRAQVTAGFIGVTKDTELAALKTQLDAAKNTTYLADKIERDGEKTRALINDLKYHDLNRGLVERNAELVECESERRHWRHRAEQNQFAGQWAQLQSQIQAFASQLQETRQGMVNFGTMAGVGQSSTSNNVR